MLQVFIEMSFSVHFTQLNADLGFRQQNRTKMHHFEDHSSQR